jgi:hypothetical protein
MAGYKDIRERALAAVKPDSREATRTAAIQQASRPKISTNA